MPWSKLGQSPLHTFLSGGRNGAAMTPNEKEIYRRQKGGLAWLAGYLVWTGLIVWGVYHFRGRAMESLDTREARAAWEEWRASGGRSIIGRRAGARKVPATRHRAWC